ncbi:flagellar hook-associated protein FlgK [Novosphingobium sp. Rr 2-17]|uniref:flagellar hook-associated protein FlgK n=1 Tax=Novosphingobium sp. Rr 2-17 TaxID=555793 RepID=UPI000269954D|nr:flagellar hook-associated protein FlgK [Novosphingobium sp. Rr 2-17]EIZ78744.1 flagellar hook-associated protein FlgK [Novosphingobium sp. Rr 2-17]
MSLNEIMASAMSGLAASQAGLRSVSNNIANVGTPGYAREAVTQTTGVTAGLVNGVTVGEPSRIADRFLEATVYRRAGDMGAADVTSSYLGRLQSLLGAPGAEYGLPARLDAITSSAVGMTGTQASPQAIAGFTANVQDAIESINQLGGDVTALKSDVQSEVSESVDRINYLLVRINDLNGSVARLDGNGKSSAGVADQRMSAIEELSGLMKVTVRSQTDGRVSIDTASGIPLLDNRLRLLSLPASGGGTSQTTYPTITVRFADANNPAGTATGDKIESAAVGGKLGGLLDLRDRSLPGFTEKLGVLFTGLSQTLNAVSNEGTTVPAPTQLVGRAGALIGSDRAGFTGSAVFAVTKATGELVASTTIDFTALGSSATVDDAVAAINAGLGSSATATFTDGVLSIKANGSGNGIVIAQDTTAPSNRGGVGFSQYFGMNDMVRSASSPLVPSGFTTSDPHGFATGETAEIVLRDTSGRALTSYAMTGSVGSTFGDLVSELNASPIGAFGSFAMDDKGRIQFQNNANVSGATLSVVADSTDRFGTGQSFSSIVQLTGATSGVATAGVRADILNSPGKLGLARLQAGSVGAKVLGVGDNRGATAFVDQLAAPVDLGKDGISTASDRAASLLGNAGTAASQASSMLADATARRDDAVNRRDSYSGVNIDEELSNMVVLQNSYSASARVITTASQMYDTLLAMIR